MRSLGADIILHLVNFIIGVVEAILGLRLLLRLVNAGGAPIVRWIYDTSDPLINPFRGMFPNSVLTGGYVLEINTLIALLVYALIGYLVGEFILFIDYHAVSYRIRGAKTRNR